MLQDAATADHLDLTTPDPNAAHANPVELVRVALAFPANALDYLEAKLAFDAVIDPSVDHKVIRQQIDELVAKATELAHRAATESAKIAALRKLLHESGPWNDHRPFVYDHVHFKDIRLKLLSAYLDGRRGNCVTMPILFLILADRLGLDVALARAPSHLFVRHRDEDGRITNLETTSGALPARDVWIRQSRNVSQLGVDTGFYMRSLTRRECVGAMALIVVEHLMDEGRYREAIAVAELISRNDPTDGFSLAHQGQACFRIMREEFPDMNRLQWVAPLPVRLQYWSLLERNHRAFGAARALGWEPIS